MRSEYFGDVSNFGKKDMCFSFEGLVLIRKIYGISSEVLMCF